MRYRQRAFRRGLLIETEDCDTSNPRKFWKYIHSLGPKKTNTIPCEVYDVNGDICYDKNTVLKTWENEYSALLNENKGTYDDSFLNDIQSAKTRSECNMQDPLYNSNRALNKPLDIDEIRKTINKSKLGKAYGVDGIPYEVLKNENMIRCLHALFQACFELSMIPSLWTQAIICPTRYTKVQIERP